MDGAIKRSRKWQCFNSMFVLNLCIKSIPYVSVSMCVFIIINFSICFVTATSVWRMSSQSTFRWGKKCHCTENKFSMCFFIFILFYVLLSLCEFSLQSIEKNGHRFVYLQNTKFTNSRKIFKKQFLLIFFMIFNIKSSLFIVLLQRRGKQTVDKTQNWIKLKKQVKVS